MTPSEVLEFATQIAAASAVPQLGARPLVHALATGELPAGVLVECGVHQGNSIRLIASALPGRKVVGFDSFEGLPESWGRPDMSFEAGAFDVGGRLPENMPGNVALVRGWFDATLPAFAASLEASGERIALLHVDCDIYSSTVTVLERLGPLLADGAVVVFDELFNYPTYELHELKALLEYVNERGLRIEWIGKLEPVDPAPTSDTGAHNQAAALRIVPL